MCFTFVESLAQIADSVLRIDGDGHLEPVQLLPITAVEEPLNNLIIPSEEMIVPVNHKSSDTLMERQTSPSATSDKRVYATYFGSIGRRNMVFFFAFGIVFTFCLRFPGVKIMT